MIVFRIALVLLASTALGAAPAKDEFLFRVAAGTTLVRTVESHYVMHLEEMKGSLNGEDIPAEAFGEVNLEIRHGETCVVTDVFEAVEEGSLLRLTRSFDELGATEHTSFSSEAGDESDDKTYESALEGKQVVFTREDGGGAFAVAFGSESEGDSELLEKLEEDMDLRAFLPDHPVSEGDSWSIDPQSFRFVLDPGGDMSLEDTEGETADSSETDAQMRANMEGEFKATFQGVEGAEGARVAVIRLEVHTRTRAETPLEGDDLPDSVEGTHFLHAEFELEGELRWDLDHGHALALELEGQTGLEMSQKLVGDYEGEHMEQTQGMSLAGEIGFSMRFERR